MAVNTDEHIVRKAIELFKSFGYNSVSIQKICMASDITKSTFYYHFKSKSDIIPTYFNQIASLSIEDFSEVALLDSAYNQLFKIYDILISRILEAGIDIIAQFFTYKVQNGYTYLDHSFDLSGFMTAIIEKAQSLNQIRTDCPADHLLYNGNHLMIGIFLDWCASGGSFDVYNRINQSLVINFK